MLFFLDAFIVYKYIRSTLEHIVKDENWFHKLS